MTLPDNYRYHSDMQFRANVRLLMKRRKFAPLGQRLAAIWGGPRRTGYFTSGEWKRNWRRSVWGRIDD